MRLSILLLALVSCLTAQAASNEVQRSLDAVDDCFAATTGERQTPAMLRIQFAYDRHFRFSPLFILTITN
jgi:hypothetical protein